jgi:hypothetical protein
MPAAIVRRWRPLLVCAPLVVGVVGLAVWRATFAALAEGRPVRQADGEHRAERRPLLGQGCRWAQLSSDAASDRSSMCRRGGEHGVGRIVSGAAVPVLRWIACDASVARDNVDDASAGQAYRVGLTIAGVLLAAWFGVLFFVYLAAGQVATPSPGLMSRRVSV